MARTGYENGLTPDIALKESYINLGIIGNENEPLLAAALASIEGSISKLETIKRKSVQTLKPFKDSNSFEPHTNEMYVDKKLPTELIRRSFGK